MNKSPSKSIPESAATATRSRRDFLKRTVAVSTVFAVPHILTKPLFGAAAPSNRVNVGQIGCGNISNYHIGFLGAMPDVRIVAVADAYKSRREATAARLNKQYGENGTVKAYADFREILARPDVDAVVVAAHDNWHTPMSIAAAKAGKDVYCQKPLGLDFGLTNVLRNVIRDQKRIFQFGTQYRSMARYRQMVQLVRNGYIGQLQRIDLWCRDVSFNVDQYHVKPYGSAAEVPVPADLDFDAWMGPSPMVPYTVDRATCWGGYHCPETSLGFIAGCGIHELGLAQWGNKADHTSPIRYAGTGQVPTEGVFRTLARWDVTCDYANGVKLRFMDHRTAKTGGRAVPSQLARRRRRGLPRHRGLDQRCRGLLRQQQGAVESRLQAQRRTAPGLAGTQPELHRLRQVASGDHLPGGDGDPLRRDLPAGEHRRADGPRDSMGPRERDDRR